MYRSFGDVKVLSDLSLDISRGEFLAVVGPSGCGKTTLLNLCSGFDTPSFRDGDTFGPRADGIPAGWPVSLADGA